MLTEIGDVAVHEGTRGAMRTDPRQGLRDERILDDIIDDNVVAVFREGPGDAATDPAAGTGHQYPTA